MSGGGKHFRELAHLIGFFFSQNLSALATLLHRSQLACASLVQTPRLEHQGGEDVTV